MEFNTKARFTLTCALSRNEYNKIYMLKTIESTSLVTTSIINGLKALGHTFVKASINVEVLNNFPKVSCWGSSVFKKFTFRIEINFQENISLPLRMERQAPK
ncbi:hypothetical protein GmHk_07G019940 [Glycine max]|nr:hypothetical protein GmHk_07G019940 [Glycine max]